MTDTIARPQVDVESYAETCHAGFATGTQVLTLDGAIPVEFLNPGDLAITRRGARAVKSVVRHTLPHGTQRIRVTADALGGKPSNDVILMPEQPVLVRDWRAKTLWGKDSVAIPAARLVDGTYIHTEVGGPQIMLSLYFGAPEILYADGLELASADKPTVAASVR